jgi:hypothetical protein
MMVCLICGAITDRVSGPAKEPMSLVSLPKRGNMANKNNYVSNERLYLDKDGNVVDEKDPNKHSLLVVKGGSLSMEEAEKYGLLEVDVEDATVGDEGEVAGVAAKPAPAPKKARSAAKKTAGKSNKK